MQGLLKESPPAILACAPLVLVPTEPRPLAILALVALAVVRAAAARPVARGAFRSRGVPASPPLADADDAPSQAARFSAAVAAAAALCSVYGTTSIQNCSIIIQYSVPAALRVGCRV